MSVLLVCSIIDSLEVIFARASNNYVVDLEYHAAQLSGQHELLLLANKRIDHEGILHVASLAHAVNSEAATAGGILDLLTLDLSQGGNGVESAVLGERHGDGVESLGERSHSVLLEARRLHGRILNGEAAGDLCRTTSVDDSVVTHEVSDDAKSIMERALGLIDDLII